MLEFTFEFSAGKRVENSALFLFIFPYFACVYDVDIFRIL